jgi:lysophospholipase L1-like esterase
MRRYAAKLGLFAATLALLFVLAEVGLRLLERPRRPPALSSDETVLNPLSDIRAPNVEGILVGHPFRTNSMGYRGPEYSRLVSANTLRIAITGDSVTMGWGVDEDRAYPALVQDRLDRLDGSLRHEVLNLGIAGASIDEAIDRLAAADAVYELDLLVYGFTQNDIAGKFYRFTAPKGARVRLAQAQSRHRDSGFAFLRVLWPRWVDLRERWKPSVPPYEDEVHHNYFENKRTWRRFRSQLARFAQLGKKGQRCTHLLIHTALAGSNNEDMRYAAVDDRVAAAALALGISVTSSVPTHAGIPYSRVRISPVDGHPNERGQSLLAESLAQGLMKLPSRCFSRARNRPDG